MEKHKLGGGLTDGVGWETLKQYRSMLPVVALGVLAYIDPFSRPERRDYSCLTPEMGLTYRVAEGEPPSCTVLVRAPLPAEAVAARIGAHLGGPVLLEDLLAQNPALPETLAVVPPGTSLRYVASAPGRADFLK